MPLKLKIEERDGYDHAKEAFFHVDAQEVILEHSLLAISKWEAKWKKPFLTNDDRTQAEMLSYISFMPLNEVDENFVIALTADQFKEIVEYIKDPHTATTIQQKNKAAKSNEGLTSELIYYYLAQIPAPFDICERWNFNRLLMLMQIASIKSDPNNAKHSKMTPAQWGAKQSALNKARRAAHKTKG